MKRKKGIKREGEKVERKPKGTTDSGLVVV